MESGGEREKRAPFVRPPPFQFTLKVDQLSLSPLQLPLLNLLKFPSPPPPPPPSRGIFRKMEIVLDDEY